MNNLLSYREIILANGGETTPYYSVKSPSGEIIKVTPGELAMSGGEVKDSKGNKFKAENFKAESIEKMLGKKSSLSNRDNNFIKKADASDVIIEKITKNEDGDSVKIQFNADQMYGAIDIDNVKINELKTMNNIKDFIHSILSDDESLSVFILSQFINQPFDFMYSLYKNKKIKATEVINGVYDLRYNNDTYRVVLREDAVVEVARDIIVNRDGGEYEAASALVDEYGWQQYVFDDDYEEQKGIYIGRM